MLEEKYLIVNDNDGKGYMAYSLEDVWNHVPKKVLFMDNDAIYIGKATHVAKVNSKGNIVLREIGEK